MTLPHYLAKAAYTSLPYSPTLEDLKKQREEVERLKALQPPRKWWQGEAPEPYVPFPGDTGPRVTVDANGRMILEKGEGE